MNSSIPALKIRLLQVLLTLSMTLAVMAVLARAAG